jgi:RNA polymerase sigma-70 factor, ECF subfamily
MKQLIDENQAWELMQRSISGDKEAFSLIYEAYFSPIYRYVHFRVQERSVAEDITQTVFLKVFEKLPVYRNRQHPPLAYLFTIARNKVIDYWRKNKPIESLDNENDLTKIPDASASAEETVSQSFTGKEISKALEKISPEQREVIILKFFNELSYEEIANILKKKEEAVRQLASRGLRSLREYFNQKKINLYER